MTWSAIVADRPDRGHTLYYEILYDDEMVAMIELDPHGVANLTIHHNSRTLVIPAEWLAELLVSASKDLRDHAEHWKPEEQPSED